MRTNLKAYSKLLLPLLLVIAVAACAQNGEQAGEAEAEQAETSAAAEHAESGAAVEAAEAPETQAETQAVAQETRTFEATGEVERVDPEGFITIRHGGVEGLGEAGSTRFAVRDLVLLTQVNAGERVEFTVESNGDQHVVVEVTALGR